MKVFVSIYKRIYRSLGKEYKKVYKVNSYYMDEQKYFNLLDTGDEKVTGKADFTAEGLDIIPGADPSILSEAHSMAKANALQEKLQQGFPLNPQLVLRKVLEAEGHEDIDLLMQTEPPQPDFKTQLEQAKFQHQQQLDTAEHELKIANTQYEAMKEYSAAVLNLAKAASEEDSNGRESIQQMLDNVLAQEAATTDRIQAISSLKAAEEKPKEEVSNSKEE